jgi:hypothetical protein
MQIPPAEPIPTLPDETNPGPVPPIGPGEADPDWDDDPLPGDDPGEAPAFPPEPAPFPDTMPPPL